MREIASWLIHDKETIVKDIGHYVHMMPLVPIELKVTAILKNLALSHRGRTFTTEDILVAFEEDEIKKIIKTHYIREWTHE